MKKTITRYLMLFAMAALIASCQQQPAQIAGYEGTTLNPDFEADIELIEALQVHFLNGDAAAMDTLLHADYMASGPDAGTLLTRQEEMDGWIEFAANTENAGLSQTVYYSFIVDEFEDRPELLGKWVLMWADMHYNRISDGAEIRFPLHVAFKLEDGKLMYSQVYYDRLKIYQDLGYELVLPDDAEETEEDETEASEEMEE